jgi:hypothetical protein
MPKMPAMITSRVILHAGGERERRADRPAVDLARGGVGDHLCVLLDRLAVEGRQQQFALAHVARADRGQDRVRADDRPQRRLAGQRGSLLRLCGEQGAHVIGVAGDHWVQAGQHASHAEDLTQLAPGAEDELDLTLVEAQRLQQRRERNLRRLG